MKSIAAIVAPAPADLAAEQVIVWRDEEQQADASAARHEQQAAAARATAKARRLMIGELLVKQRAKWPTSGPNAKGWGEWLAKAKLDDSTAWRYMEAWKNPDGGNVGDSSQSGDVRGKSDSSDGDDPANVHGGSRDPNRGKYCTPKKWADAIGPWDLDPFSNPRSHIVSRQSCQLERGDNGLLEPGNPGAYLIAGTERGRHTATESTRVFIQPDYSFVEEAIEHYKHTRFCALLRFAPDTGWFDAMWPRVVVIAIPRERIAFEAPDGIEADGAPFPHVFYYADERDATDEIRRLCIVLRVEHPKGGDVSLDEPA